MNKYIKKPIVVEAIQLTRENFDEVMKFIPEEIIYEIEIGESGLSECWIAIHTPEGIMTCWEGNYIIKGIKGEFYPCQEDIFNLTYDKYKEKKSRPLKEGKNKNLLKSIDDESKLILKQINNIYEEIDTLVKNEKKLNENEREYLYGYGMTNATMTLARLASVKKSLNAIINDGMK